MWRWISQSHQATTTIVYKRGMTGWIGCPLGIVQIIRISPYRHVRIILSKKRNMNLNFKRDHLIQIIKQDFVIVNMKKKCLPASWCPFACRWKIKIKTKSWKSIWTLQKTVITMESRIIEIHETVQRNLAKRIEYIKSFWQ